MLNRVALIALLLSLSSALSAPADKARILILGDSLTAGYGIDPDQAWPALLQEKIDEEGLSFEVFNAGVSGDTSAGGLARIDWLLKQPVRVLVLELGANDGLRGINLTATRKNLQDIIDRTRARYPAADIVIAGMMVPPNLGPEYTRQFRSLFEELAVESEAVWIPFLLEGVAGRPEFNLPDGIHPTPQGHAIIADTVWDYLRPLLR
jgi:acyl-CoA thioesterase I